MALHVIPAAAFDQLARGDGDALGAIRSGQRSKRMALLHEVVSTMRTVAPRTFEAADGSTSTAVLVDAQRRCPTAVDDLLLHPQVGAWASHCLGRLLDGPSEEKEPPYADVGHLGAVAAAAALRAGTAFEVTAYAPGGTVALPSYGCASLESSPGWCRVRSGSRADGVEIASDDVMLPVERLSARQSSVCWHPLHRLQSSTTHGRAAFDVDDLDPYRGCGHLQVAGRLSESDLRDWQSRLDEAWALLCDLDPERAGAIARGVRSLVPLVPTAQRAELSATCHTAIGAVALTPPPDALAMALALVHEYQHTKLSALLDLVPLLDGNPSGRFYAPWRPDPRPARGLLQGVYAYLGLAIFWECYRHHKGTASDDQRRAHFELDLTCRQVRSALVTLQHSDCLTDHGQRFVHGLWSRLAELEAQPVPVEIRALAAGAFLDNRAGWRLRNIETPEALVRVSATAWCTGGEAPPLDPSMLDTVDGGGPFPADARLSATRAGLVGWTLGDEVRDQEGLSPADLLLLEGRAEEAAWAYEDQLAHDPHDLASWAGLVTAQDRAGLRGTAALVRFPESVQALYVAVQERTGSPPDLGKLAAWMSKGLRGKDGPQAYSGAGSKSNATRLPATASVTSKWSAGNTSR